MGQSSGHPITTKSSEDGSSKGQGVAWGASCMQGWRESMEDAHLVIPALQGEGWEETSVFGVFDGHGGEHVARFVERHLGDEIARGDPEDVGAALTQAFVKMDEMLGDPAMAEDLRSMASASALRSWFVNAETMGCTSVVCCLRREVVYVANAGDSRAVLCRDGKAIEMSEDHKPNNPSEKERIQKAGGTVETQQFGPMTQHRVNGNLNLSRSIGDLLYKQNESLTPKEQMITCVPDVTVFDRTPEDEFMVIACDGIWDVVSSQEVCDFVRPRVGPYAGLQQRLRSGNLKLSVVMENLLDHCVSPDLSETWGIGGDNMTALVVVFEDRPPPREDSGEFSPKEWRAVGNHRQGWCNTC